MGQSTEALDALKTSLEIMEQLTKADPDNSAWQRDLDVLDKQVARVQDSTKPDSSV